MMVGLQGSGKTTTTAKIAKRLTERGNRKVLMASLDTRRPAAMEQLAVLGQQVNVQTLPIVEGQTPVQIAGRAIQAAKLGGYDVVLLDTAGRITLDEAMMTEAAEVKRAAAPHEMLLVADSLTGQDAVNLARSFDERVGLTGIVLTRVDGDGRGGAALSMRAVTGKPIKLIGTGERMDALEDFDPARIAGRILGMGDIVSLVEKAAANIDREQAMRTAEKMRKGQFDLSDLARAAAGMAEDGRHERPDGDDARRRQDQEPDGRAQSRRQRAQAPDGDHRLDDAGRAQASRHPQSQPQEAHRGGLRHQGRGDQQAPEDAPEHGRHDEGDGRRQGARPDGRSRADARASAAACRRRKRWRSSRRRCRAALAGFRRTFPGCRLGRAAAPTFQDFRASGNSRALAAEAAESCRRRAACRRISSRKNNVQPNRTTRRKRKELPMPVVIRMARAGTKKRPFYHIVAADSRAPRDGRFIERLGYFNPLLPKDKQERLKLDMDKVKDWMKKGAQPSDRVMRFLDAAGVAKREKRNNPEKAVPRKERKAQGRRGREGRGQPSAEASQGRAAKAAPKAATKLM